MGICCFVSLFNFTKNLYGMYMFRKKVLRKLYLMRHGRASVGGLGVSDRERLLEAKGIEESQHMGDLLVQQGLKIDLLLCSNAARAYATAQVMADVLGYPVEEIRQEPMLYLADDDRLMTEVMALSDEVRTVLVVAHNPGLTDLVNGYLERPMHDMPPSAVVGLEFKMNHWNDMADHDGKVICTLLPHTLF